MKVYFCPDWSFSQPNILKIVSKDAYWIYTSNSRSRFDKKDVWRGVKVRLDTYFWGTESIVFAKDSKFDSIMIKVHLRALEGYLHTSEVEKDEDS